MSDSAGVSFDLVDEPWLLARDMDGVPIELSLIETFRRAGRLVGLVGDVPTQVFALTRLLLAVLHGAVRGPVDVDHWERLWAKEDLPVADIESYLDRHRARFDLFHRETPFMQVADLRTAKDEVSDLGKLIADVPNGHRFFTNRAGPILSLTFAEAARWLVHCHAFDPAGIKSGAVGDARVKAGKGYPIGTGWSGQLGGILPEGATLRETLLLNLIPRDFGLTGRHAGADLAVWERGPDGPGERGAGGSEPAGPVELFTWQSRRLRLVVTGGRVTGVLICNGDRATPQNRHLVEVHTAWRRSQAQEKKLRSSTPVYMPLEHDPERVVWRGLEAILPRTEPEQRSEAADRLAPAVLSWLALLSTDQLLPSSYPVRIHTIGMIYGSQNSTTVEIVEDMMSIQAVLLARGAGELKGVITSCVTASELAARALGSLAANLAEASGGEITGPRTRAIELAYAQLDPLFRHWVSGLGPTSSPPGCQTDWHQQANQAIRSLGEELMRAAPAVAWVGRRVNKRLMTVAHAELWFRRSLRKALPFAYQKEEELV